MAKKDGWKWERSGIREDRTGNLFVMLDLDDEQKILFNEQLEELKRVYDLFLGYVFVHMIRQGTRKKLFFGACLDKFIVNNFLKEKVGSKKGRWNSKEHHGLDRQSYVDQLSLVLRGIYGNYKVLSSVAERYLARNGRSPDRDELVRLLKKTHNESWHLWSPVRACIPIPVSDRLVNQLVKAIEDPDQKIKLKAYGKVGIGKVHTGHMEEPIMTDLGYVNVINVDLQPWHKKVALHVFYREYYVLEEYNWTGPEGTRDYDLYPDDDDDICCTYPHLKDGLTLLGKEGILDGIRKAEG